MTMNPSVRTLVGAVALVASASLAEAQECFVGQVRFFAGNFVPAGHVEAHGQLMPLPPPGTPPFNMTPEQRTAQTFLALFGTTYGGNGTETVGVPDLRGRAPLAVGQDQGTSNRLLGEAGGAETVTLGITEMPAHSHLALGSNDAATSPDPGGNVWAGKSRTRVYSTPTMPGPMDINALEPVGASAPIDNMTPFLALKPLICAQGVFPARP